MTGANWFLRDLPITAMAPGEIEIFVDGREYFRDLHAAMIAAERYVLLTGLHFEANFELLRGAGDVPGGSTFRSVVETISGKGVKVHLLVNQFWQREQEARWPRTNVIRGGSLEDYLPETYELFKYFRNNQNVHCRTEIHPNSFLFGAHHQKTVVIDSKIAYLGGVDVTSIDGDRWDTPDHAGKQRSVDRAEAHWHDIQMRTGGTAVRFVYENFARRWRGGNIHRLAVYRPSNLARRGPPTIRGVPESRYERPSLPAYDGPRKYRMPSGMEDGAEPLCQVVVAVPDANEPGHELDSRRAYLVGIEAARKFIYLENQWVTDERIWEALERSLRRNRANPEFRVVVVVLANEATSAAGLPANQDRDTTAFVARAMKAHPDLRAFGMYSIVQPSADPRRLAQRSIYVHSKLLIVDDCSAFVGSANAGGTSMQGVRMVGSDLPDSELGAIIVDRNSVTDLRRRLWTEHLQRPVGEHFASRDADAFRAAAGPSQTSRIRFAKQYRNAMADYRYRDEASAARRLSGRRVPLLGYPGGILGAKIIASFPAELRVAFPISRAPAAFQLYSAVPLGSEWQAFYRWELVLGQPGTSSQLRLPLVDAAGGDASREFTTAQTAVLPTTAAVDIESYDAIATTIVGRIECFIDAVPAGDAPDNLGTRQGKWRTSYSMGFARASDSDRGETSWLKAAIEGWKR